MLKIELELGHLIIAIQEIKSKGEEMPLTSLDSIDRENDSEEEIYFKESVWELCQKIYNNVDA